MVTLPASTLIPQLELLSQQINEIEKKANDLQSRLNQDQALWSPDKNHWSILECMEHLCIVGELILPRMRQSISKIKQRSLESAGPFKYNIVERFFIRCLSPNTPVSMPVPPPYNPREAAANPDKIWERFFALQINLHECIEDANGYNLKRSSFSSPVSPLTRFTLGAWMEGTVAHERYHWGQIEALLQHPDFPK